MDFLSSVVFFTVRSLRTILTMAFLGTTFAIGAKRNNNPEASFKASPPLISSFLSRDREVINFSL